MNTFFTADTHFGHSKIIQHCKRPFASADEMDETLIERWNKAIKPGDQVWHLGDFSFRSKKTASEYLARLNGQIHIVWGNHDDADAMVVKHLFITSQHDKYLRLNGEKLALYHYAQRVWRNSHHGAWHLYGHSHGSIPNYHRSMDVGVDTHQFTPYHFDEVKAYMETQDVTDHHPEMVSDPWDRT